MKRVEKKELINAFDYEKTPISFDIETTNTEVEGKKFSFMYIWQLGIGESITFGRYWHEFIYTVKELTKINKPTEKKPMVIYVHNLSFEFQFFRKYFKIKKYLANDLRTPIAVLTDENIEFRCSYLLSGVSLEKIVSQIKNQDDTPKKLTGYLDYEKIRNSKTHLTEKELQYCENDIAVMQAYLKEQIEEFGSVHRIPYTKTGKVRRLIKQETLYKKGKPNKRYFNLIKRCTLSMETYNLWREAYAGGWTHANAKKVGFLIKNVHHVDLSSSYPAAILSEKYPYGKGRKIEDLSIENIEKLMHENIVIMGLSFKNIKTKNKDATYLSKSKMLNSSQAVVDNGRVVQANYYNAVITSIDYEIIKRFYTWEDVKIIKAYAYSQGYLPAELIEICLRLYEEKTKLKGNKKEKINYNIIKSLLNSIYGAMVQDPLKISNEYDDIDMTLDNRREKMKERIENLPQLLKEYNESKTRWGFYPWGVCVSAYARRNLFMGIKACGSDFIYADTDSIFFTGDKAKFFNSYNEMIRKKIDMCLSFHGLNVERSRPMDYNGKKEQLGIWDNEGDLKEFKTLGAKRYAMIDEFDNFSITIAGLSKEKGGKYIYENGGFIFFTDDMKIDAESSGRITSYYCDTPMTYEVEDYEGNKSIQTESSFVHLEKSEFNMSIGEDFKNYLMGLHSDPLYSYVLA